VWVGIRHSVHRMKICRSVSLPSRDKPKSLKLPIRREGHDLWKMEEKERKEECMSERIDWPRTNGVQSAQVRSPSP